MSSSAETSPDPIILASSPPSGHSNREKASSKPARRRANVSPARTFVIDPSDGRDPSPWRIRVTVESNEMDTSPDESLSRSTKVPLYDSQLSSPTKRRYRKTPGIEDGFEVKRPSRKRKGTPGRETTRPQKPTDSAMPTLEVGEGETMYDWLSPVKMIPSETARDKEVVSPRQRSQRLSQAREELGLALKDAVGSKGYLDTLHNQGSATDASPTKVLPGDLTVSMNEDFTMVSVDSLQSYKNRARAFANVTLEQAPPLVSDEEDQPGLQRASSHKVDSVTDPITYPDLTKELRQTSTVSRSPMPSYDAMSWKPTGPPQNFASLQTRQGPTSSPQKTYIEPSEWRLEREAVSREIENANTSQVIVINDITIMEPGADAEDVAVEDNEADIWQEEASRSLDEDRLQQHQRDSRKRRLDDSQQPKERSPQLEDLFADEPVRPRRSKIPRTWRRTSGLDLTYSDSPGHGTHQDNHQAHQSPSPTKRNVHSDGESRGSGVLTPPSTDDENAKRAQHEAELDALELTEPDAVATILGNGVLEADDHSGSSPSESGDEYEEGNHAHQRPSHGLSWKSQQPRRKAADLSDILQHESSPAKISEPRHGALQSDSRVHPTASGPTAETPVQLRKHINFEPFVPKLSPYRAGYDSPWRKSLFRASNIRGSPVRSRKDSTGYFIEESLESPEWESQLESQTAEMAGVLDTDTGHLRVSSQETRRSRHDAELEDDESTHYTDPTLQDPSRSYEEYLNLESPAKVRVNFNESLRDSSLLAPRRSYPTLVGEAAKSEAKRNEVDDEDPSDAVLDKPEPRGILSRITSTLWNALVRPQGPSEIYPAAQTPEPDFPADLRARIRSRYGVVSKIHTWNMVHMRTLHRMVNSITSGKSDSIIPKTGPLPSYLSRLLDSEQTSVAGFKYIFDMQNAQIVFAFLQIMVEPSLVAAMEEGEIEFLGDWSARKYRETDVLGRRGKDTPWPYHKYKIVVPDEGTLIDWAFVVRALGDAIFAHNWEIKQQQQAKIKA